MLPNETKVITGVNRKLRPQLDYAQRALREMLVAVESPIYPRKEFPLVVQDMAIGLHVRICRKFRQALLLTEIGQADGVEILCRSMYEAALAQAFVCRQTVKLKRTNGKAVDLHGRRLTQLFRAQLFLAHTLIRDESRLEHMSKHAGLKRLAAQELKLAKPVIDDAKKMVGSDWSKTLRGGTCTGLSIKDFAYSLGDGLFRFYRTVYAIHSGQVHPGEYHRFTTRTKGETTLRWQDESDQIELALCYATAVASLGLGEFAKLLNKAHQPYLAAHMFEDTYPEFKKVFARAYGQ
jgi:hypothetical protein